MVALKVIRIGSSKGLVIPKEQLEQMKLDVGDTVYLTKASGGARLTPYQPAFEEQLGALPVVGCVSSVPVCLAATVISISMEKSDPLRMPMDCCFAQQRASE